MALVQLPLRPSLPWRCVISYNLIFEGQPGCLETFEWKLMSEQSLLSRDFLNKLHLRLESKSNCLIADDLLTIKL